MGHHVCSSSTLELLALEEAQQHWREVRLRHQEAEEELQVELVVPSPRLAHPLSPVDAPILTKALLTIILAVEYRSRVAGRSEVAVSRCPLGVARPLRSRELGQPCPQVQRQAG